MSYAGVDDMVLRFGQAEMITASTPDGAEAVAVVPAYIQAALDDATSMIDSFLRKRYRVPLDIAPPEIMQACCKLARYEMSTGGQRAPSEQVTKDRDSTMAWLKLIAEGKVVLGMAEAAPGDDSFATMQTRNAPFDDGNGNGSSGYNDGCSGGFYSGGWP
ncbi:MAG: hypothetical protein B7Z80_04610 [Rhodospirillales bacterium 20-64-7]|nr:MAG: hypothetical protein B7Z80_04610 [Rhodospirillales bacterium 20-64-7]